MIESAMHFIVGLTSSPEAAEGQSLMASLASAAIGLDPGERVED